MLELYILPFPNAYPTNLLDFIFFSLQRLDGIIPARNTRGSVRNRDEEGGISLANWLIYFMNTPRICLQKLLGAEQRLDVRLEFKLGVHGRTSIITK